MIAQTRRLQCHGKFVMVPGKKSLAKCLKDLRRHCDEERRRARDGIPQMHGQGAQIPDQGVAECIAGSLEISIDEHQALERNRQRDTVMVRCQAFGIHQFAKHEQFPPTLFNRAGQGLPVFIAPRFLPLAVQTACAAVEQTGVNEENLQLAIDQEMIDFCGTFSPSEFHVMEHNPVT